MGGIDDFPETAPPVWYNVDGFSKTAPPAACGARAFGTPRYNCNDPLFYSLTAAKLGRKKFSCGE